MAGPIPKRDVCSFAPCDLDVKSATLCQAHYTQRYRGQELRPLRNRLSPRKLPVGAAQVLDADGQKRCSQCLESKAVSEFHANRSAATGLDYSCKSCRSALYDGGGKSRARSLLRKYGLTMSQYDALLVEQGGACAICQECPSDERSLSVDHDHSCCPGAATCGECVRGLLCAPCNSGIGYLGDSAERLARATNYLQRGAAS